MTNTETVTSIEQACTELTAAGRPVTFTAVATRTRLSRTTLYRNPTLRALIDEHRKQPTAGTITRLTTDIATLTTALELIAARVRHHEEQLRQLRRQN